MNSFEPKLSYYNPYRSWWVPSLPADPAARPQSKVCRVAELVIMRGTQLIHKDFEKQVDLIGRLNKTLTHGTQCLIWTSQILVALNEFTKLTISPRLLIGASKLFAYISGGLFLGFGCVEGAAELVSLSRLTLLSNTLENPNKSTLDKIIWIKNQYFKLLKSEVKTIYHYIENNYSNKSRKLKALKYDEVARKVLRNRFYALENRITKNVAHEVGLQIKIIMSKLKSYNPLQRRKAKIRAEKLLESVSRQARNKIIVHVLKLHATVITILNTALAFSIFCLPVFLSLSIVSFFFVLLSYCVQKGLLDREVDLFHQILKTVKLPVKGK